MEKELSYCRKLVKENDPDRFLISMLMPPESREALWALFAFNHEISKTREVVRETALGHIRLQWWRDAIASVYEGGAVIQHEVIAPLAAAISSHNLPRVCFDDLIDARAFDLENVAPTHLEGLLIYADHTSTPLVKLAVQIIGGDPEIEPVQPVAMNYALVGILRSVAFHKAQGVSFMPADLIKNNNLQDVVKVVIDGGVLDDLRPQNRFLRASNHLASLYLRKIKALKYDVLSSKIAEPPPFMALRMLVHGVL